MSVVYKRDLFGLNKDGTLKVWGIRVKEYTCPVDDVHRIAMVIRHGKQGGKIQEDIEFFTEGKQGRRPLAQAVFESQSRVKKQFDKNYRDTPEELNELPVLAMLAQDASGDIEKIPVGEGVLTSDKFDGLRCLAKCFTLGKVSLFSRTNQEMSIPHIEAELAKIMNPGDILDGEIYYHGEVLQDIQSAAKRTEPRKEIDKALRKMAKTNSEESRQLYADAVRISELREKLEFHVFDYVELDTPFSQRVATLLQYASRRFLEDGFVKQVKYKVATSYDDLRAQHKDAVERGYEGLMVRTLTGLYESGKRSRGIWKLKAFLDAEFLILDIIPDKKDGSIFICLNNVVSDDGKFAEFSCVMGTIPERIERLENKQIYVEKYLTVQYQSRYKRTLKPQFGTGKYIRAGEYVDGEFVPDE